MAKKRRKQEQLKAEKEWKPPEFDRVGYMRTEVNVAKGTLLGALLAVPMALSAMFTYPVGGTEGGLLIGLSGMAFLWVLLPRTRIDVSEYKPMHWLSVFSTYFLLFLALWVLMFNPPFADYAAPAITQVQVSWDGGAHWENVTLAGAGNHVVSMPANITPTGSILVRATVTDNGALDTGSVNITVDGQTYAMTRQGGDVFESPELPMEQAFGITVRAMDAKGHLAEYVFDIEP